MATFTLYLPDEMVRRLDERRAGRSRSGWIRSAVEVALDEVPAARERMDTLIEKRPPGRVERSPAVVPEPEPPREPSKAERLAVGQRILGKPVQPRPIIPKRGR